MINGKVFAQNVDHAEWTEGMTSFALGLDQLKTLKDITKVEESIENNIKKLLQLQMGSGEHQAP